MQLVLIVRRDICLSIQMSMKNRSHMNLKKIMIRKVSDLSVLDGLSRIVVGVLRRNGDIWGTLVTFYYLFHIE